jgi:tetratricopeptide (TPR) repeat protein
MNTRGAVRYHFFVLILAALGFILYLGALRAPFVFDDRAYVIGNPAITSLSNFWGFSGTRYVGYLSFALNYAIGGLNPFDFHLTNVLIHIINSILVFYLLLATFRTPVIEAFASGKKAAAALPVAVVVSLIFLAHPVQTQSVTYITQRFASLATLFYLLSLFLYVKARLLHGTRIGAGAAPSAVMKGRLLYLGALLSTVLAMKTKEISFTIPFMIALYDYLFFPASELKRTALLRIPFYLTLFIIPLSLIGPEWFRASDVISGIVSRLQVEEAVTLGHGVYIMTQFRVILTYMRLLLLPVNQRIDYDYQYSYSFFDPATLASFLLLSFIAAFSIYAMKRSYASKNPYGLLFSFGLFWFFITLTVESFLVPIQDVIFEQRVYLPGVGFIMATVAAIFHLAQSWGRRLGSSLSGAAVAAVILVLTLPPLSYGLHKRNSLWGDELALVNEAIGERTGKARLYYFRALVYMDRREYLKAVVGVSNALILHPMLHEAYNLRGFAYLKLKDNERAVADFTTAIALKSGIRLYYYNRGVAYEGLGDLEMAVADHTGAIELSPDFALPYNNRGLIYAGAGDTLRAAKDLDMACSLGLAQGCENLRILNTRRER